MALKIIQNKTVSISDVKRSPTDVFREAKESNAGVYVFNRGEIAGVMLTQEQYNGLNEELSVLYERIIEMEAAQRLSKEKVKTLTDLEVRGAIAEEMPVIDENDGWE